MFAIRGATTIGKNNSSEIKAASIELFGKIIEKNELDISHIVSITLSCTDDITAAYPGKYIRKYYNLHKVAIMHFNEMNVENSLKKCIRILVLCNGERVNINYVYLKDAISLRKDLINK